MSTMSSICLRLVIAVLLTLTTVEAGSVVKVKTGWKNTDETQLTDIGVLTITLFLSVMALTQRSSIKWWR